MLLTSEEQQVIDIIKDHEGRNTNEDPEIFDNIRKVASNILLDCVRNRRYAITLEKARTVRKAHIRRRALKVTLR